MATADWADRTGEMARRVYPAHMNAHGIDGRPVVDGLEAERW
jgi:hypothetical protein